MLFSCHLLDEDVLKIRSSSNYRQRAPWGSGNRTELDMKGYTFFLGAAFLLTTTGAALAQNNLQSAKQRVGAITNAGTVQANTSTPGGHTGPYTGPSKYPIRTLQITPPPSPQIIPLPQPRPSTVTVSGAVQQPTVNTGKSGQN